MREFAFSLSPQELSRGLRQDYRSPKNEMWFDTLTNLRCSQYGLIPPCLASNPISSPTQTISWPHPMIHRGEKVTLETFATSVYQIDESTWSGTLQNVYSAASPASTWTFTSGSKAWKFVSFRENWFLTNGLDFIYRLPANSSDKVLAFSTVTVQAIGKDVNQERLLLGGMEGTWLTGSTDFTSLFFPLWQYAMKDRPDIYTFEDQAWSRNWIMFSDLAGGATDTPFVTLMALLGFPDTTSNASLYDLLYQDIEQGRLGFFPLRSQGMVRHIQQLGDNIICYCDDAIHLLTRDGTYYRQHKLLDIGVKGRSCVGGDHMEHVWIDSSNCLWRMRAGGGPERLYRSEFMDDLTAANVAIAIDQQERDFYIGDGALCYVMSPTGMFKTTRMPTSLCRPDTTGLVGVSSEVTDDTAWSFTLALGDLGVREMKTVKQIDLFTNEMSSVRAAWDYRYNDNETWKRTPLVRANLEKVLFPLKATALEFRLYCQGVFDSVTNSRIERIGVHYQNTGRRNTRGSRPVEGE